MGKGASRALAKEICSAQEQRTQALGAKPKSNGACVRGAQLEVGEPIVGIDAVVLQAVALQHVGDTLTLNRGRNSLVSEEDRNHQRLLAPVTPRMGLERVEVQEDAGRLIHETTLAQSIYS
jgi:hypothetical protein